MRNAPSNTDDVIDSRAVIERIKELESERDGYEIHADPDATEPESDTDASKARWAEDNVADADELKALQALASKCEGYGDWSYGETLIRDSYFEDYAQQTADDIGAIDRNAGWPLYFIDWPAAAAALKQDYTSVDFDGVTYWMR